MCIATYSAKPLTSLEVEILSKVALAGPLLAATVAHVNKQVGSHNLYQLGTIYWIAQNHLIS